MHKKNRATLISKLMLVSSIALLAHSTNADETGSIKRMGIPGSTFPISLSVSIPAMTRITFVSGTLAEVSNPAAEKGSIEAYGNTQTQTTSILNTIAKRLAADGLTLADVVKVNVFMVGDPKLGGKMDFEGLNAAYNQFFGGPNQPNKPVRTALQVVALPMSGALLEIEATAAKVGEPSPK